MLAALCLLIGTHSANGERCKENVNAAFQTCLDEGYTPETLEGCVVADTEISRKVKKKCAKV